MRKKTQKTGPTHQPHQPLPPEELEALSHTLQSSKTPEESKKLIEKILDGFYSPPKINTR